MGGIKRGIKRGAVIGFALECLRLPALYLTTNLTWRCNA